MARRSVSRSTPGRSGARSGLLASSNPPGTSCVSASLAPPPSKSTAQTPPSAVSQLLDGTTESPSIDRESGLSRTRTRPSVPQASPSDRPGSDPAYLGSPAGPRTQSSVRATGPSVTTTASASRPSFCRATKHSPTVAVASPQREARMPAATNRTILPMRRPPEPRPIIWFLLLGPSILRRTTRTAEPPGPK